MLSAMEASDYVLQTGANYFGLYLFIVREIVPIVNKVAQIKNVA